MNKETKKRKTKSQSKKSKRKILLLFNLLECNDGVVIVGGKDGNQNSLLFGETNNFLFLFR